MMVYYKQIPMTLDIGLAIHSWCILPEKPLAALQLCHGMMEHSERYRPFAEWMAEHGIAVYAADHAGHGQSVDSPEDLGHLDVKHGWEAVMEAQEKLRQRIDLECTGIPVLLMGHSFGSAVARSFIQRYGKEYSYACLILSGAMMQSPPLLRAGLGIIALQRLFQGQHHRSRLMITLGHGQYAKPFAPARTLFDWLSSVPEQVDKYLADPLCGYACTLGYYRNFFKALLETWEETGVREMPSRLPVLLLGGSLDPAIQMGSDTRRLASRYRSFGMSNITVKLYPEGRHEMHNEVNKMEVWEYYRSWIIN
jgi:alpha-beta hydrolase superfamily lysophospholipase